LNQIKQILLTGVLLFFIVPAMAQHKKQKAIPKPVKKVVVVSGDLKRFQQIAAQANVSFTFPQGFKEIKVPDNEDFSFDYGVMLPGKDFEIWFQVKSQKENWNSYVSSLNNKSTKQANPDSLYISYGNAHAIAFTGGTDFYMRNIPPRIAARYNGDAGKSFLLNLLDMPVTKHYKYALLITLQKDHIGTILAVAFTNEKGPEFFKNMDRASNCIKFKP